MNRKIRKSDIKDKTRQRRVPLSRVSPCHGMMMGWRFLPMEGESDKYGYIHKFMPKGESISFKEFWQDEGGELFAKWLWKEGKAHAYENKDGIIVITGSDRKGKRVHNDIKKNSVLWKDYRKKYIVPFFKKLEGDK